MRYEACDKTFSSITCGVTARSTQLGSIYSLMSIMQAITIAVASYPTHILSTKLIAAMT